MSFHPIIFNDLPLVLTQPSDAIDTASLQRYYQLYGGVVIANAEHYKRIVDRLPKVDSITKYERAIKVRPMSDAEIISLGGTPGQGTWLQQVKDAE